MTVEPALSSSEEASELLAIDSHIHVSDATATRLSQGVGQQISQYFGRERPVVELDELAEAYRSRRMRAVLVNTNDTTVTGRTPLPNDHIAGAVKRDPDVFMGMGVIDPWQGKLALDEIYRCKELGLVGIGELNPARQHFMPHDQRFYPLWEAAAECGLVVMFHGGYAAAGSGTPGGRGVKLRYSRPAYLDDVAADFPSLTIICAHPSWPWESEALAIAQHKGNVFMDLSGFAPKYFSDELKRYIRSRISDKVLFGTDWPALTVERWMSEFDDLGLPDAVRRKILVENATRVFDL